LGINNIVQLFLLDGFILISRHSHGYILGDEGKKGFQELLYKKWIIDIGFSQGTSYWIIDIGFSQGTFYKAHH
jgi:hypothetical protein